MSARVFLLVMLMIGSIASAIGIIYARHLHRQAYVELTRLERQRDELNIEFGRLQIEQATWSEANRIEQVASERLGMLFPQGEAVEVLRP